MKLALMKAELALPIPLTGTKLESSTIQHSAQRVILQQLTTAMLNSHNIADILN